MTPDLIELGGPVDTQHITISAMADEVDSEDPTFRTELEHIRLTGYVQFLRNAPPTELNKKMPFIAEISRQRPPMTDEQLALHLDAIESQGMKPHPCRVGTIGTRGKALTIFTSLRPEQYDRVAALAQHQAIKGILLTYRYEKDADRMSIVSLTVSTNPEVVALEYEERSV